MEKVTNEDFCTRFLNAEADYVFDATMTQYKAMTAYLKWKDIGIIAIPNMTKKVV